MSKPEMFLAWCLTIAKTRRGARVAIERRDAAFQDRHACCLDGYKPPLGRAAPEDFAGDHRHPRKRASRQFRSSVYAVTVDKDARARRGSGGRIEGPHFVVA
jgi:hypothetical protein